MTRFTAPLATAALLLGLALPLTGQASFGVKAGMNIATLGGDDVGDVDSRTGLVVGGLVHYRLSDLLAVQPELLYSQKGAKFSETLFGEPISGTFKLDYLEVPVLLRVDVPTGGPELRPSVHAGPTFALELSCKVSFSGFGESGTEDCDSDIDSDRRTVDLGMALGGGLDVAFRGGTLLIEARYTLGLRTLDSSSNPEDVKNRVWSITFGYRLR